MNLRVGMSTLVWQNSDQVSTAGRLRVEAADVGETDLTYVFDIRLINLLDKWLFHRFFEERSSCASSLRCSMNQ